MGSRRRHAVEHEPAHTQRRVIVQRADEQLKGDGGVLALQRSAGNRAIADQLQVARDPAGASADVKKGATVTLSGLGAFAAASLMWRGTSGAGGSSGGGGTDRSTTTEIVITASIRALGDRAPKLSEAAAQGRKIETADIEGGGMTIHLKDCYVGSFQSGSGDDPMVTFTLTFGSIEYGDKEQPGKLD